MAIPRLAEACLYLRSHGVRAALGKFLASYVVGRQTWYVTVEDLTRWTNVPLHKSDLEIRPARFDDLARMEGFRARQPLETLRDWLGPEHFFFIALVNGEPISYRCVSTLVHPALTGFLYLERDQLFMVDEFTCPPFRRRGITRQLAIVTNPIVLANGYRHVIGIHRPDNLDTIAATRAKGIPTVATTSVYRFGPKRWMTYIAGAQLYSLQTCVTVNPRVRYVVPARECSVEGR